MARVARSEHALPYQIKEESWACLSLLPMFSSPNRKCFPTACPRDSEKLGSDSRSLALPKNSADKSVVILISVSVIIGRLQLCLLSEENREWGERTRRGEAVFMALL